MRGGQAVCELLSSDWIVFRCEAHECAMVIEPGPTRPALGTVSHPRRLPTTVTPPLPANVQYRFSVLGKVAMADQADHCRLTWRGAFKDDSPGCDIDGWGLWRHRLGIREEVEAEEEQGDGEDEKAGQDTVFN